MFQETERNISTIKKFSSQDSSASIMNKKIKNLRALNLYFIVFLYMVLNVSSHLYK
jgi:hypothetical protein